VAYSNNISIGQRRLHFFASPFAENSKHLYTSHSNHFLLISHSCYCCHNCYWCSSSSIVVVVVVAVITVLLRNQFHCWILIKHYINCTCHTFHTELNLAPHEPTRNISQKLFPVNNNFQLSPMFSNNTYTFS